MCYRVKRGCGTGKACASTFGCAPATSLYIPANVPHLPYNASAEVTCTGLIARTDPNEQERVTLLDMEDPGIAEPAVTSANSLSGRR